MHHSYKSWCIGLAGIQRWHWIAWVVVVGTFGRQGITPLRLHQKITGECWIRCGISTPIQRQQESGKGFMTPIPITGITAGWKMMALASGTQAFYNWHRAWRVAPGDMHGSASTTGTKVKVALGAIGAQGCWNDWLKKAEAVKAGRTGFHQDSRNYPLLLTSDSIKYQKTGIKLLWYLEGQMASVMAIKSSSCGD